MRVKETIIKNTKYCELVELIQHKASKILSGMSLSISVCLSYCLTKHSVLSVQIILQKSKKTYLHFHQESRKFYNTTTFRKKIIKAL